MRFVILFFRNFFPIMGSCVLLFAGVMLTIAVFDAVGPFLGFVLAVVAVVAAVSLHLVSEDLRRERIGVASGPDLERFGVSRAFLPLDCGQEQPPDSPMGFRPETDEEFRARLLNLLRR